VMKCSPAVPPARGAAAGRAAGPKQPLQQQRATSHPVVYAALSMQPRRAVLSVPLAEPRAIRVRKDRRLEGDMPAGDSVLSRIRALRHLGRDHRSLAICFCAGPGRPGPWPSSCSRSRQGTRMTGGGCACSPGSADHAWGLTGLRRGQVGMCTRRTRRKSSHPMLLFFRLPFPATR